MCQCNKPFISLYFNPIHSVAIFLPIFFHFVFVNTLFYAQVMNLLPV